MRCRVLELMHPDYLEKIQKTDIQPIFIVGAGRSGNTLLARLLHETGGVHFGPENYTLCDTYLRYLQHIDAPWEKRVDCILELLANQEDSWRWRVVDVESVRKHLLSSKEHTLGNIIHAWYLHYGRAIGYPSDRWGCKTPNLTPFIGHFLKIFPSAKVTHIVRHPKDVIISYSKTQIEPYNRSPKHAELHWYWRNSFLIRNTKVNSKLVLYEDLSKKPTQVVEELCYFLGINKKGRPVTFMSPDLASEHLDKVMERVRFYSYGGGVQINPMTIELYNKLCGLG